MAQLVPKHGFEWWHANSGVVGIVVPELGKRNPETPSTRTSLSKAVKESLDTLVNTLYLAISLRVVSCAQSYFRTCTPEQLLPEVACEDRVSV